MGFLSRFWWNMGMLARLIILSSIALIFIFVQLAFCYGKETVWRSYFAGLFTPGFVYLLYVYARVLCYIVQLRKEQEVFVKRQEESCKNPKKDKKDKKSEKSNKKKS